MSKLVITDLVASTDLDSKAMASVYGGELSSPLSGPLFSSVNTVLDFDFAQAFNVGTAAANTSHIGAAQGNVNGNGTQQADQYIDVYGYADANSSDIGNLFVGGVR